MIVQGQPASCSPSAARCDSGLSQCHRGERLKGTKPSRLSGSKGTVQAQSGQLSKLAPGLVELHSKAVDSGSPSIKVLTGTNLHQIPVWPSASACYLHTKSHVQLCQACLESGIQGSGPKTASYELPLILSLIGPQSLWLMGTNTPFLSTKETSHLKSRPQRQPGNRAHAGVAAGQRGLREVWPGGAVSLRCQTPTNRLALENEGHTTLRSVANKKERSQILPYTTLIWCHNQLEQRWLPQDCTLLL